MVWFLIVLTAITYGFVMNYVLQQISKTAQVHKQNRTTERENMVQITPLHSVRS